MSPYSGHIHGSHHHQNLPCPMNLALGLSPGFMDPATAPSSVAQHLIITAMQKMAVERARSGEIGIRPSERRRQVEEAQMAAGGGAYGAPRPDAYGAHPLPHGVAQLQGCVPHYVAMPACCLGDCRQADGDLREVCLQTRAAVCISGGQAGGRGGFGGGGRGFAGRTGYDYGNGGGRGGGGRGGGFGAGAGYQPTGNYQGGGGGFSQG